MTLPDIPVQANESDEDRALRHLAGLAGWRVTHTTDGAHASTSLHKVAATNGVGRAVDLGDRAGGVSDPPTAAQAEALLRINEAVIRLLPLSLIAELIYGGPHAICVKDGKRVDGRVAYSAVIDQHRDHIHLAVVQGFVYNGGTAPMPDDPNLPNLPDIMGFYPVINTATGSCTGYYILSKNGELHAFGPGAQYYGRSEVPTP